MKLRDLLTRRNIIIASALLIAIAAVASYFWLRRPPRSPMERYIPASAFAFIEIDNLSDVVDGLTDTKAWRELAPALGLSSQLRQIGFISNLIGRTGLGPDEAVIAGRAQFALALTGLEAETGAGPDGPYVHFKPRVALIVETHTSPETAARIARERSRVIADRIYGAAVAESEQDYQGAHLFVFHGADSDRQLVVAASGAVVLLANHLDAIKPCLDAVEGRAPALVEDAALKSLRPEVDADAAVFAYVTAAGIEKLAALGPALIASRFQSDPESVSSVAALFEHLSSQAAAGLFYSAQFKSGIVVDKYLTALNSGVAGGLNASLKAASGASFPSLQLVPREIEGLTILNVERAGEMPERALKSLAPHLDVVAGIALRELVISFRKQYGIESGDSAGDAVGNEIAMANFGDGKPMAMLASVKDKTKLAPLLERYLTRDSSHVATETYGGVEIRTSSHEDGRAAAFVGSYLILGTRDQVMKIIDTESSGNSIASDERLKQAMATRPSSAAIISYKPEASDAGELMLAISKLTRVTDGSRELLEQGAARQSLERLPPAASFTEFRSYGIYTETRSAVGNFSLFASLARGDEEEEKQ
jgi:uncharacterized protein DUF3352